MSTVIYPSDYNVEIAFPDGTIGKINLFQMDMMAKAVKFRAEHGRWYPELEKMRYTKQQICDRFYIAPEFARTYKQLADTLRECHDLMAKEREDKLKSLIEENNG